MEQIFFEAFRVNMLLPTPKLKELMESDDMEDANKEADKYINQTDEAGISKAPPSLINDFIFIITDVDLSLDLANEFTERDLLKVYKKYDQPLKRYMVGQIILIIFALILSNDRWFLGAAIYEEGMFDELCGEEFSRTLANGNVLGLKAYENFKNLKLPTDITPILVSFLIIHILDYIFFT